AVSGCSRGEAQLAREHPPAVPGPWGTVWRGAPPPLVLQAVAHGAGWRCGAAVDVVADVGRGGEAAVQRQPVQLVEDPSGQEEAHRDLPQLVRRQGEGEPGQLPGELVAVVVPGWPGGNGRHASPSFGAVVGRARSPGAPSERPCQPARTMERTKVPVAHETLAPRD